MRYEHWLSPSRPAPWPGAVLCVEADVDWQKRIGEGEKEFAGLKRWHITLVVRTESGYKIARRATGTDRAGFWQAVRTATLRGRNVWVLSARFRECAAALGLWEGLENGQMAIAGAETRRTDRARTVPDLSPEVSRIRAVPAEAAGNSAGLQGLRLDGGRPKFDGPPAPAPRRRLRSGCVILQDPPIVLELTIDGGGGKITWVDAENYGIDCAGEANSGDLDAETLACWFCAAASALQSLGPCGWCRTVASQSIHLYRSVFHDTPTLCHTEKRATALERSGLFGGRCEPFRIGFIPGRAHLVDFRALYGFLYSTVPVPVRLVGVELVPSLQSLCQAEQSTYVIADVEIRTDKWRFPVHYENQTIYATGRYKTVLCGPELRRAVESGCVVRAWSAARYEAAISLGRYAHAVYALRCRADSEGHGPLSQWTKRLLNCLHGKFAQTERQWEHVPRAESPWQWAEWYHRLAPRVFQRRRAVNWRVEKELKGGFADSTVPAISCAIAAAGRERLQLALTTAGERHVYYCDTDALIVDDAGLSNLQASGLMRPGEWGFLQLVTSADECTIGGVKRYQIGDHVRAAGCTGGATPAGITGQIVSAMPGIRDQLQRQQPPAEWRDTRRWTPAPSEYSRRVDADGWVLPIKLEETKGV